jgi:PAS domain S-box-containing protein
MVIGVEAADAATTRQGVSAALRLPAIGRPSYRLHRLVRGSPALAAVVGLLVAAGIAETIAGSAGRSSSIAIAALVLLAAAAVAAVAVAAGVARWLEVLGRAFDAAGEAQLVAAPDGRALQANTAFERLVGGAGDAALDAVENRAADGESAAAFRMLRMRAAAGAAGFAVITLRAADEGPPRRYEISVEPGVGRRGYALWRLAESTPAASVSAPAGAPGDAAAAPSGGGGRYFSDAPVGIAVVDRDGRFIEANPALGDLFGAAPERLVGCQLAACLDPADRAAVALKLAAAVDGREDRAPVEIRLAAPGERVLVMLLGRLDRWPQSGGSGAGDGMGLYFIDVTERKHLETQFSQSQKMQAVGRLAGGVAHDFNNLLTAIIGFCDLLLLRARPGDPVFSDIMHIKQNANRAANLVRQLLAFSRQQSLLPRVLDVTDVLAELAHLLRRLIGENIGLEFIHGRDLGLVKVDQGQLEQVVINLAVNARDAMPDGGRLTIRTGNMRQCGTTRHGGDIVPAGDYVLIEIADTGTGIAPDHLPRIFEPFFSTKEAGCGTGLGLATVYGIVKQTGGFVSVNSVPGAGTRFAIYLPRHKAGAAGAASRPAAREPPIPRDLTGDGTILFVEDDDAVRLFAGRALRNKGYRVVEAKGGETALEAIHNAKVPIDLVITDVVMPQMDGPTFIREVWAREPRIKVIFISGYAEDAFRQRLDDDRDIHFLPKPFSLKELAAKVKEVFPGDPAALQISRCISEQNGYDAPAASRCAVAPAVK